MSPTTFYSTGSITAPSEPKPVPLTPDYFRVNLSPDAGYRGSARFV
jgi:hypothetical protein